MSPQLVDSHCHIPLIHSEAAAVIAAARNSGVSHMLCVAVDLEGFPRILELAEQHDCVFASVGVHPNATETDEPDEKRLVALAAHPRVIAIGETGLDYYRSQGDLDWQQKRFRTHIRAAVAAGKPLVIHSRNARADVIGALKDEGADRVGGVMHCFVDDWDSARAAMDLGFYISFSGIVTFKNAKDLQDVARQVPIDRLLIETDSPYLAPVPVRGKENQPAYVRHVAEFLAGLRGETFEYIASGTAQNFFKLFAATP
ncbi:MAG: TatD family hydrolase [Gammaproteobacteria bacterium]|nr:TatD family hydrolase [Gammaproteobacteria bacterium]